MLAELLLDLTTMTHRLGVLLGEADDDEFKSVRSRFVAFATAVRALPTAAVPRKQIGFKVATKKKRAAPKKKKR